MPSKVPLVEKRPLSLSSAACLCALAGSDLQHRWNYSLNLEGKKKKIMDFTWSCCSGKTSDFHLSLKRRAESLQACRCKLVLNYLFTKILFW